VGSVKRNFGTSEYRIIGTLQTTESLMILIGTVDGSGKTTTSPQPLMREGGLA